MDGEDIPISGVFLFIILTKKKKNGKHGKLITVTDAHPKKKSVRKEFEKNYKLYHLKQYQYFNHPILSVALNITTKYKVVLTQS